MDHQEQTRIFDPSDSGLVSSQIARQPGIARTPFAVLAIADFRRCGARQSGRKCEFATVGPKRRFVTQFAP